MRKARKRVLLIVPPFYRLMGGKNNWIHLGLSYIAAVLNRHGCEVKVYNADQAEGGKDISLREVFQAHELYRRTVNNPAHEIWREISDKIKTYSPDVVGITMVLSATFKTVENIARLTKEIDPDIEVVVGGPHATLAPDLTMQSQYFDYLVRGEGEYPLLELMQGKDIEQIEGLTYRGNGAIIHNQDRELIKSLDDLPFPDINLQLMEMQDVNENFGVISVSRGCPFRCIFCSSPRLWRGRTRFRSIENVLEEIKQRYYKHGVNKYYFSDDNINLNIKYGKQLFTAVIENGLDIEFICEAKIGFFDRELLSLMKKAGCQRLKLGMESGSDRILKLMKKEVTVEQIRHSVSLIHEAGIDFTLYTLIGMPTETVEEMEQTLELARELNPKYVSLSVATPHIGTELYDMMIAQGVELPVESWDDYYHQSDGTLLNKNVNSEIIEKFLRLNELVGKGREI